MIDTTYFIVLFLVSLRLISFTIVVPIFFPKGTPQILKVMFSVLLAFIITPVLNYTYINNIDNTMQLITFCLSEITTGLTFGFITNICFYCIRYAGALMDIQVGFAMLSIFDPTSNSNVTLIERLINTFSLVTFLIVDGHHILIKTLVESFDVVSIGKFILSQKSSMFVIKVFVRYFELGLRIAIPIILVIILTDLTLGLIARTVPQLNVMILGLPIKILLGLTIVSFSLPFFYNIIGKAFNNIPASIRGIYRFLPLIMIFSSEDKTEEATPHKLSEAKKKGQVAKSKEITSALTLLTSTILLITLGEYVANSFKNNIVEFFTNYLNLSLNSSSLNKIIIIVLLRFFMVVLPIAIPIMIIGVAGNFLQTGFVKSTDPIKPKLSKLNPISGFKKIFSFRTVMELFKDLAVVIVVGSVGYKFIKANLRKVLTSSNLTFPFIIRYFFKLVANISFKIALVMISIALIDFIYQKYQFKKDMRMSKQEIKEEFKQTEGDPQIKGKIRQKQREFATRRMMQNVPEASVVITNPTHIAVALKYKEGEDSAPLVVAKGKDYMAIKIKKIAKENDVPIMEDKPLARLIFDKVEIDREIPSEMYQAVAEILAALYKLKK